MASAGCEPAPPGPDDALQQRKQQRDAEQAPEQPRQVHEVTESSSDESSSEAPRDVVLEQHELKAADMPAPDVVEAMRAGVYMPEPEELYNTRNVADMHYLFTNDKLKEESPAVVLRSDPFCIPRVTDNVPNYRPMLNPLSIFLGEDKLLPGNFRLDPSERPPKTGQAAASKKDGSALAARTLPAPPGSSASSASSGKQFRGKTSAFMGTMPRQTEFAEIPVSEKLFQNHEVFRPTPPIPRIPASPSRDKRLAASHSRQVTTSSSEENQVSTSSAVASSAISAATSASLSDAMLLSSIQHTLDVTTAALTSTDGTVPSLDSAANAIPSASEGIAAAASGYHIQPLQPLESVADTLTNYLPSRSVALDDGRPVDGQYFSVPGAYSHGSASVNYATGGNTSAPGTFGSLLSPVETQAHTPYPGLFVDSGEGQSASHGMQSFSTALSSISITTPTNGAANVHTGLITPQGGVARAGVTTPRRPGAKKPRAKNVFRPCTAPGCTKGARGKSGRCQKHGGGKRCAAPNCPKGAQGSSNMCLFHGGGYRCTVEGCTTGARGTSGLCAKHGGYKKGKAGSAIGKRGPEVEASAAKRVRTDNQQQSPATVNAE
ncbi:unnamed protein product [Phytophthora fragariaefolia]|uniref:Unnamed protein product n=1 Tax=Phytophthora fragariaefolia TaxID=1490495 RepID=A0A9W6XHQ1_9STRA|nr:unnamed protein product [Phytophthora fragariaefolia]